MGPLIEDMTFIRNEFDEWLINHGCIGFYEEPVTLSSGRYSPHFANLRKLTDTVPLVNELFYWIGEYLQDQKLEPDYFYGVPDGASKLGILLSYRYGEGKLVQGRKISKTHGEPVNKDFIGSIEENDHIVVFDDTITTGNSTLKELEKIKRAGAIVDYVVAIIDRFELREDGKTVKEAFTELDIPYVYMTAFDTLIPRAFDLLNPRQEVREKVVEYLEKYSADLYFLKL